MTAAISIFQRSMLRKKTQLRLWGQEETVCIPGPVPPALFPRREADLVGAALHPHRTLAQR